MPRWGPEGKRICVQPQCHWPITGRITQPSFTASLFSCCMAVYSGLIQLRVNQSDVGDWISCKKLASWEQARYLLSVNEVDLCGFNSVFSCRFSCRWHGHRFSKRSAIQVGCTLFVLAELSSVFPYMLLLTIHAPQAWIQK